MCKACNLKKKQDNVGYDCVKQSVYACLSLTNGVKVYGQNWQFTEVKECPRVTMGVSDYTPCETVCNQFTHAERDAIWKAISLGYDVKGATMTLTGHWVCCDDCRSSMKAVGIKEAILINENDKIINRVSFDNNEELGIMEKDYSEALEAYKS